MMSSKENNQLNEYAQQLNRLQADIQANDTLSVGHGKVALDLAVKAGTLLNDAKKLLQFGQWEDWLSANVKDITQRTAQNYMKLAKRVSVLADCQSLGEAYLAVGVKKKARANTKAGERETGGGETTPEKAAEQDDAQYQANLTEAHSLIVQRVRGELAQVNWDLETWAIKGDEPGSGDATNHLVKVVHQWAHFILFRDYTTLKPDDEIRTKTTVVLTELLNKIIRANHPAQPDAAKGPSDDSFQLNPQSA